MGRVLMKNYLMELLCRNISKIVVHGWMADLLIFIQMYYRCGLVRESNRVKWFGKRLDSSDSITTRLVLRIDFFFSQSFQNRWFKKTYEKEFVGIENTFNRGGNTHRNLVGKIAWNIWKSEINRATGFFCHFFEFYHQNSSVVFFGCPLIICM